MKFAPIENRPGEFLFHCPGCGCCHCVWTENANHLGAKWSWNGDANKPTVTPSLLVTWDYGENSVSNTCHSFITDGKIQFLSDCTHQLAGQTVEIPDWKGM